MGSLKKITAFVGILLGLVSQAVGIIQLFKNNFATTSLVFLGIGFCIAAGALISVIWSRVPSVAKPDISLPRYSKHARLAAAAALIFMPIALTTSLLAFHSRANSSRGKFVILITAFAGPNSQSFRVSEITVEEVRRATQRYPDIEVRPIARTITAQEGSAEARKLGAENSAAIVLWGWYGATSSTALATVHFEILSPSELQGVPSSKTMTPPLSKLNNFTMQMEIAKAYSSLSLITAALARYEQHDYSGAVDRFNAAEQSVGEDPSLLDPTYLYFHRGTAYIELKQTDLAIKDLSRCTAQKPDFAAAFINRAVAFHDAGRYAEAKADADSALRLDATQAIAYNTHGVILDKLGDLTGALQDFNKAIDLDPRLSWAYNNRGYVYSELGDIGQAIKDYDRAIEYGSILAFNNRAMARYKAGAYKQAIADFDESVRRDPNDPFVYAYRGLSRVAIGEKSTATADCDKAVQLSPKDKEVYDVRGIVRTETGDFEGAERDFDTAIKLNPKFARSYFDRGVMHMRLQHYNSAIENFTLAIKLRPTFADAYLARADAYQKTGRPHLAFRDLAAASNYGKRLIVQSTERIGEDQQSSPPTPKP